MSYRYSDQLGDALSAKTQVRCLQMLQSGEEMPQVWRELYTDEIDITQCVLINDTDDLPMTWAMLSSPDLHIFIRGSTRAAHFIAHDRTWRRDYSPYSDTFMTRYHSNAGDELYRQLNANSMFHNVRNVRIIGHSLGGASATALACKINSMKQLRPIIHTIGSPKCLWHGREVFTSNKIKLTRWYAQEDAVAGLPPNAGIAPLIYSLLTPEEREYYGSWSQPLGGAMLLSDGRIQFIERGGNFNYSTITQVAQWMSSWIGNGTNNHSIGEYLRRLTRASIDQYNAGVNQSPSTPAPSATPIALTPEVEEPSTPEPEAPRLTRTFVMQQLQVAQQQVNQNQTPPVQWVPLNPKAKKIKPWMRQKKGFLWEITHNGEVVGVTPSAKIAHETVLNGNQLDGWQKKLLSQEASIPVQ